MEWRDELISGLPAPRGDEPASLRRDIEDELADHLHCAMQRERVTADDDETARKAVLKRFGNPRLVAYKLWWDAMKEKIMKDRLMMGASVALLVTCILAVGALWLTLKENRQVNAALLAQIRDLASRPAAGTAASNNQASLKLKMVLDKPPGKPVADYSLTLEGYPFSETRNEIITLTTNSAGVATVGPIRAGRYFLRCSAPRELNESILLYEGQTLEKTIVCPEDLTTTPTAVRLMWPKKMDESLGLARLPKWENVYLMGRLYTDGMKLGSTTWYSIQINFLISSHGEVAQNIAFSDGWVTIPAREQFSESIPMPRGNYRLAFLALVRGRQGARVPFDIETDFNCGMNPQYNVSGISPATLQLTIPESVQEKILKRYPSDAQSAAPATSPPTHNERLTTSQSQSSAISPASLDPNLTRLIRGSVRKVLPIIKDCMILKYMPDWAHGEVDNIGIDNNDGGVRMLLDWPAIAATDVRSSTSQFLLALYSRQTYFRFKNAGDPQGAVLASVITRDWPENTSWKTQPPINKTPAARFDFTAGDGWKLLDVTPLVRARATSNSQSHGIMLHFANEDCAGSKQDWSGYHCVSREGLDWQGKDWTRCHPMLIVVEPLATASGKSKQVARQ